MKDIKFISYSGKYPNLCRGVLTVSIDGVETKFGHNYSNWKVSENRFTDEDKEKPNYPEFWMSGGYVSFDSDWNANIGYGPWEYNGDLEDYNEFDEETIQQLLEIFNSNVQDGCCGGCI